MNEPLPVKEASHIHTVEDLGIAKVNPKREEEWDLGKPATCNLEGVEGCEACE